MPWRHSLRNPVSLTGTSEIMKPDFIIAGFSKCGTTSLAEYLDEHPNIYMVKPKEPRFYVADVINKVSRQDPMHRMLLKKSILTKQAYEDLYNHAPATAILKGEASVHYANHYEIAIPAIKKHAGDIPIILLLRDPIARAISNWRFITLECKTFEASIDLEMDRIKSGYNSFWWYKYQGIYTNKLRAFLDNFTKVKILIFEEFIHSPQLYMTQLYEFLQLPEHTHANFQRHNIKAISLRPKGTILTNHIFSARLTNLARIGYLRMPFRRLVNAFYEEKTNYIPLHIRNRLHEYYREDRISLENLLGRQIPCWQ